MKPIEPRIKPLVDAFNRHGFSTFASCEGHSVWFGSAAFPYVAFTCDEAPRVQAFAKKLLDDQIQDSPALFWAWSVEPFFNAAFEVAYRLNLLAPHRRLTRFVRSRLDSDFMSIGGMLHGSDRLFHSLNEPPHPLWPKNTLILGGPDLIETYKTRKFEGEELETLLCWQSDDVISRWLAASLPLTELSPAQIQRGLKDPHPYVRHVFERRAMEWTAQNESKRLKARHTCAFNSEKDLKAL